MLRRTFGQCFLKSVYRISKPPVSGYEMSELPSERVLYEFMQHYQSKGVIVVVHSADAAVSKASESPAAKPGIISEDPLLRTFVSSMNTVNFGNPSEVKIALVPGKKAPTFVREFCIVTYPTTLLFFNGKYVDRCVGARTRELSIKSLFMLRNGTLPCGRRLHMGLICTFLKAFFHGWLPGSSCGAVSGAGHRLVLVCAEVL
eukprot:gene7321-5157_t